MKQKITLAIYIDCETWYKVKEDGEVKLYKDPGRQVKYNILKLKEFLRENGIKTGGLWIDAIVVMVDNNVTVQRQPHDYTVLGPVDLPDYITNARKRMDIYTVLSIGTLIKPCTMDEISY